MLLKCKKKMNWKGRFGSAMNRTLNPTICGFLKCHDFGKTEMTKPRTQHSTDYVINMVCSAKSITKSLWIIFIAYLRTVKMTTGARENTSSHSATLNIRCVPICSEANIKVFIVNNAIIVFIDFLSNASDLLDSLDFSNNSKAFFESQALPNLRKRS